MTKPFRGRIGQSIDQRAFVSAGGEVSARRLEVGTMIDIRATDCVRPYYPDAIKARWFVEAFLDFARYKLGIGERKIAYLTSICSDDLNTVELPKTRMVGPFIQGGLDGYPFVGKTGLVAFSHHFPDCGAGMMFIGPHIGITQTGLVGKVIRPGQSKATDCCGAAALGLQRLEDNEIPTDCPPVFDEDDYQQQKLEQILLKHKKEILHAGPKGHPQRFIRMTELLYGEMKEAMNRLMENLDFEHPTFVFGGILINEDKGVESSIALRDAGRVEHGKYADLTKEFKDRAARQFKELEEGKTDVFR